MKQNQRKLWIDIAKGIAIILMVIGHTSIPKYASDFIWTFHMPLFFIASGWTSNWARYNDREFVVRKVKSLIVPFFIYSSIVLIVQTTEGWITICDFLTYGWVAYALWFIPVLFISLICAKGLYCINDSKIRYIVLAIFISIGYILSYNNLYLPWSLSSVPYATFLIVLGTEMKKLPDQRLQPRWYSLLILLAVTIIVSRYIRLDMCFNNIIPIIPITIGAVAGTLFVFQLSMMIAKYSRYISKCLAAIGRETYIIVAFSQITIMLLNEYFNLNVTVKYGILVLVIVALKYLKDAINRLFNTKLL